jgi:hypothetical protein
MFKSKLPHMLCAKCNAKVARDAYYCKSCGEVIDDVLAPGLKKEDGRFSSKFKYALQRHLIRNVVLLAFAILFIGTGIKLGINHVHTVKDNGSSAIYKLTVVALQDPMTCRGAICHINIDLRNKSDQVQKIESIPDLVTSGGKSYGPADPARMGNGENYCRQKITLTLQPHQTARYLGICAADIPAGTTVTLAELRDLSGNLLVSGVFHAVAY